MTTVVIGGGGDIVGQGPNYTVLQENLPTTNVQSGGAECTSYGSGDRKHLMLTTDGFSSVLAFLGLSAPVTVNSASLSLTNSSSSAGSRNFDLHRIIVGTQEAQSTWTDRVTSTAWTTAGALGASDVNLTPLDSISTWVGGTTRSFTGASLVSYVQGILNGTISNQGVLMVRNSDTAYDSNYDVFSSYIWTLDVVAGGGSPTSYYLSDTVEM